jgi:hypothetical protein
LFVCSLTTLPTALLRFWAYKILGARQNYSEQSLHIKAFLHTLSTPEIQYFFNVVFPTVLD